MKENNLILNRLFTQNFFYGLLKTYENPTYKAAIQRFLDDYQNKDNKDLISEIYRYMSKNYRNEYFYKNTLLNKLLLGKHSLTTTTALSQIPISKSKADFILINGKAVVYEIKTELDTFDRLESQLRDYYKAFDHVCVVTSESRFKYAEKLLCETPVGIYVLTSNNTISAKLRREPKKNDAQLDLVTIFKVLNKNEYEKILLNYYGELPQIAQAFYFQECLKLFQKIPIEKAYEMALHQLKSRKQVNESEFLSIPYELKALAYFSKVSSNDMNIINRFLGQKYGG